MLAFVSAPGGSSFMEELLEVVADAVRRGGGDASCHRGNVDALRDTGEIPPDAVPVVVPHEYFSLQPPQTTSDLRHVVGFGVEHPGTAEFETAAAFAAHLGASVEVSAESVAEMRRRGIASERFVLGCSPVWDRRRPGAARDIDLALLATADEHRLRRLAAIAPDLASLRTELLLPPNELKTNARPDFLLAGDKWELLARTRLLLNLHRAGSTAFEWVRALEAISNGCVVLTEPSTGLQPLVPGEELLVAQPAHLGRVAAQALREPGALDDIAARARAVCTEQLDMVASARRLVDLAGALPRRSPRADAGLRAASTGNGHGVPAPAHWVPRDRRLPHPDDLVAVAHRPPSTVAARPAIIRSGRGRADTRIDVVCASCAGDGPVGLTLASLSDTPDAAAHVVYDGTAWPSTPDPRVVSALEIARPIGRGAARNRLLPRCDAPLLLVVDAGDELLAGTVRMLVEAFDHDPALDIATTMAVGGSEMIFNAIVPEAHRLARHAYLGRGYAIRREALDRLGGFTERPELEPFVDHDLWRRATELGLSSLLLRRVGLRWWRQERLDDRWY